MTQLILSIRAYVMYLFHEFRCPITTGILVAFLLSSFLVKTTHFQPSRFGLAADMFVLRGSRSSTMAFFYSPSGHDAQAESTPTAYMCKHNEHIFFSFLTISSLQISE